MIIVGYPGIGKTTISGRKTGCIDLESSLFHSQELEDWFDTYCELAFKLSKDGFIVMVSSHEDVVKQLKKYYADYTEIYVICPHPNIKYQWIYRLLKRYEKMPSDKNFRAFQRAKKHFDEDIHDLIWSGLDGGTVTSTDYDLMNVIVGIKNFYLNSQELQGS